jgi:hypothetical protein
MSQSACPKEGANAQNDIEQPENAHGGIADQSDAEANGGCLAYPSAAQDTERTAPIMARGKGKIFMAPFCPSFWGAHADVSRIRSESAGYRDNDIEQGRTPMAGLPANVPQKPTEEVSRILSAAKDTEKMERPAKWGPLERPGSANLHYGKHLLHSHRAGASLQA